MKSGTYTIKFDVELTDVESEEEARNAVAEMLLEYLNKDEFPEVKFELVEESFPEYQIEEELPEVDFG